MPVPEDPTDAVPLERVLEAERKEIEEVRKRRATKENPFHKGKHREPAPPPKAPISGEASSAEPEWQTRDKDWVNATKGAHKANLVGLAFSGGGIRSATFNLGVLQALAELKLLYRVDYLSTVSGGGYIGGWLAAWSKRLKSFAEVQKRLATNRVHQEEDKEPTPIRFLRMFSNYLTPKLGIFSGDTWAMVGIYLRNMLLNQVALLAVVAAVLLMPRVAERVGWWVGTRGGKGWDWIALAGGLLLLLAFVTITNNMEYLDSRGERAVRQLTKPGWILALVGVPLFLDAVLGGLRLKFHAPPSMWNAAGAGAVSYGMVWIIARALAWIYGKWLGPVAKSLTRKVATAWGAEQPVAAASPKLEPRKTSLNEYVITVAGAVAAGALAGWLYALLAQQSLRWTVKGALTVDAPLVLGILLLTGILHIGLMGVAFSDRRREWWGRLGGLLLWWGLVWIVIFWVALYFPDFIRNDKVVKAAEKAIAAKYLTATWIATTVGGVLAGKSSASGKAGTQTWKDVVAKVGPYAFIAGLLCWVSYGIDAVQHLKIWSEYRNGGAGWLLTSISKHGLWWAVPGCVAVAVVMAWRVDVNEFSMHLFYRNRLVRCYLGASNENRSPNRFTGFDADDDIPLKDLKTPREDIALNGEPRMAKDEKLYDGPYPILNASLNLVKGKDLAWQERKAESFVMTPLYCGFDVWLEEQDSPMMANMRAPAATRTAGKGPKSTQRRGLELYAYRLTDDYAFPPPLGKGLFLGTAMGISGAAASPNMGSYSSMPVAFLMTVFNVRLGQWAGNPRNRTTWNRSTPRVGLSYLLNELLGGTDDESAYVYLSDGGHFENMALYELVKRRCGLIIVCDAEADGGYGFGGLGNAIRKCRIDLGIDIRLDVSDITPAEAGEPSKKHCAVGTIHYEQVDVDAPTGTIIYFKASLTGDESTDVKNYKKSQDAFPHESTIDQWFSETQFESYRKLGYHEVMTSLQPSGAAHGSAATVSKEHFDDAADSASQKKEAVDKVPLDQQLKNELVKFGFDTTKLPIAGENANC
jgi:hypothetical protein